MASAPAYRTLHLNISADVDKFETETDAKLKVVAKNLGENFSKRFSDAFGNGLGPRLAQQVNQAARAIRPIKVDVDLTQAEARLRNFTQGDHKVGVEAELDLGAANAALTQFLRDRTINVDVDVNLPFFATQRIDAEVDLDTTAAEAKLQNFLRQRLLGVDLDLDLSAADGALQNFLRRREIDVDIDVDTAAAEARIAQLVRDRTIDVGFNVGNLGAIAAASSSVANLGIALSGLAIIGVPAIASLVAGFVSLGLVAGTAFAAVAGVGALAFSGIGAALKETTKQTTGATSATNALASAQNQLASAASGLAGAQSGLKSATAGLEGAQASLKNTIANAADAAVKAAAAVVDAQQRIKDAVASAADANSEASDRVIDAHQRVTDAVRDAAQANEDAAIRVKDAEQSLADAQRDATDAQLSLTEARKEAAEQLQDLNNDLVGGQLDQRQAALDIRDAEARLAEVQAKKGHTQLEIDQAQLRVDKARQRQIEVDQRNVELADKKAKSDKAGIEGSDPVLAAKKRISDANTRIVDAEEALAKARQQRDRTAEQGQRNIAKAQEDLADAEKNRVKVQLEGTKRIKEAEAKLAEARKAQAAQERANQFSIDQARRGVVGAESGVDNAKRGVADARRGVATAQAGVASAKTSSGGAAEPPSAYSKLGESAKAFVDQLKSMGDGFSKLKLAAQDALLPSLTAALKLLQDSGLMPLITTLVTSVGKAMGEVALKFAKAFTGPGTASLIKLFTEVLPVAIGTIGDILISIGGILGSLFTAAAPAGQKLLGDISAMFDRIDKWAKSPEGQTALKKFFDGAVPAVQAMGRLVGSIISLIGTFVTSPAFVSFVNVLTSIVNVVRDFVQAHPEQVTALLWGIFGALIAWKALMSIVNLIFMIQRAVMALGLAFNFLAANPIVLIIAALVLVAIGLFILYQKWEWFHNAVDAVVHKIAEVATWLWQNAIKPALEGIGAAFTWLYNEVIKPVWENYIKPAFAAISTYVTETVWPAFTAAIALVGAVFTWLYNEIIEPVWTGFIKPLFNLLSSFVTDTVVPAFALAFAAVGAVFTWLYDEIIEPVWTGFIKPLFNLLSSFVTDTVVPAFDKAIAAVGAVFTWLYDEIIEPVWTGFIKPLFELLSSFVTDTVVPAFDKAIAAVGAVFTWLYEEIIEPVWTDFIKPLFETLGDFIEDTVAPAFQKGVDAIGKAWESIKDIVKKPIEFIVNTVINGGIIDNYNKIAKKFGVSEISRVSLPSGWSTSVNTRAGADRGGFATGGSIHGPGTGTSDSIPIMASNGEYMIRAAAVSKLGVSFLDKINRADKIQGFAAGGSIGSVQKWIPSVDPLPYVWGGVGPRGYDCSGLVGEVWNRLTGNGSYRRRMTTRSGFSNLGFKPGVGTFTMGVNPGRHMAGNLAGLPFEAASTRSGIKVGSSARNVKSFSQQWYLPRLGTGFVDGGGGGGGDEDGDEGGGPGFKELANKAFHLIIDPLMKSLLGKVPSSAFAMAKLGGGAAKKIVADVLSFDQGGWLTPGKTLVENNTGKPEAILNPEQWQSIISGTDRGKGDTNITVTSSDERRLAQAISREQDRRDLFNELVNY